MYSEPYFSHFLSKTARVVYFWEGDKKRLSFSWTPNFFRHSNMYGQKRTNKSIIFTLSSSRPKRTLLAQRHTAWLCYNTAVRRNYSETLGGDTYALNVSTCIRSKILLIFGGWPTLWKRNSKINIETQARRFYWAVTSQITAYNVDVIEYGIVVYT